jgi:hypothetical protein
LEIYWRLPYKKGSHFDAQQNQSTRGEGVGGMKFEHVYLSFSALTVIFVVACAVYAAKKDGTKLDDTFFLCVFSAVLWPFVWLIFIGYGIGGFIAKRKGLK